MTGSGAAPASPRDSSLFDAEEQRLDARVVMLWRLAAGAAVAVPAFLSLIPLVSVILAAPLEAWAKWGLVAAWFVLVASGSVAALTWPQLRYRHESYRLPPGAIEIRRGVLWRRSIHVPRSRVQHTDVSRGPLERAFGLATLVIYTAGTEHASVGLSGLPERRALEIRDALLPGDGDDAV